LSAFRWQKRIARARSLKDDIKDDLISFGISSWRRKEEEDEAAVTALEKEERESNSVWIGKH
jgi:hypothetical protein